MNVLNKFLEKHEVKEGFFYSLQPKSTTKIHSLSGISLDRNTEFLIYNRETLRPPTHLEEEVMLETNSNRVASVKSPQTDTTMNFFEALVEMFPKIFNCRLFLGNPLYFYAEVLDKDGNYSPIDDVLLNTDGKAMVFDNIDFGVLFYTEFYDLRIAETRYSVIITNTEETFKHPQEAEEYLFKEHVLDCGHLVDCLKYTPRYAQYYAVWGEGYSGPPPNTEGESLFGLSFFTDENGFEPSDRLRILALHRGESINFNEAPVPQYMSVVRIF